MAPNADVNFALQLLGLCGYKLRILGGPFGPGWMHIAEGYRTGDVGYEFWGGGFHPPRADLEFVKEVYLRRNLLDPGLKRAIEINHLAFFAPDSNVRTLLCMSALERLMPPPPKLAKTMFPDKVIRAKFQSAVRSALEHLVNDAGSADRFTNGVMFTQAESARDSLEKFCRAFGFAMSEEHWTSAHKVRNAVGHGGTPSGPHSGQRFGDTLIWDVLSGVIRAQLQRFHADLVGEVPMPFAGGRPPSTSPSQ